MSAITFVLLMCGWATAKTVAWWALGDRPAATLHAYELVGWVGGLVAGVLLGLG